MNALNWITREAKRLRRKYPRRFKEWRQYVAQASAIYAKKHKGRSPVGKKKKRAKVGAAKYRKLKVGSPVKVVHILGSVQHHIGSAKKLLEDQIGSLEVRRFKATKSSHRKKIAKQIQEKKSKYRKLF